MPAIIFLAALWVTSSPCASAGEAARDFPIAELGQIGGRIAVALVPLEMHAGNPTPLPTAGFSAHLVPTADPSVELVYRSGDWFQPPAGSYRYWLESEEMISPYSMLMSFSGRPFKGRGGIGGAPVGQAGRVSLPSLYRAVPQSTLRLLSVADYLEGDFPRWELSRRRASTEVAEGVLMPSGRAVAAVWDEKQQRYSALSRPFEVPPRQTVVAPLEPAPAGAHLVWEVRRAKLARSAANYEPLAVEVELSAGKRAPTVLVQAADRFYAIWYDLPPGPSRLIATTGKEHAVLKVELEGRTITRLVGSMRPSPALPWER